MKVFDGVLRATVILCCSASPTLDSYSHASDFAEWLYSDDDDYSSAAMNPSDGNIFQR